MAGQIYPRIYKITRGVKALSSPAIYVENLRKVYGNKVAVESLSLEVQQGEVFGFLGPNGAGKTTTIKMLNGLITPTAGKVSVLGKKLGDLGARKQIGFLPEHFRFHEWLKAYEFLDFHGSLYGMSKSERKKRIPEVLKLVGLEHRADSRLRTFSKGMLQRIGIAQAIIANPKLVFLDEPTSALDPIGRRDVRDLIVFLRDNGVTVFLNSHLLSEVERVCDRIAIIKEGKVAAIGPVDELLHAEHIVDVRATNVTPSLLEAISRRFRLMDHSNNGYFSVSVPEQEVPALVEMLVASGANLYELKPRQRSLEDIFVDIVQVSGDR